MKGGLASSTSAQITEPGTHERRTSVVRRAWDSAGMMIVCIAVYAGLSAFVPHFLGWPNQQGLLLSVATTGVIACTMLFCIAAGDVDLSVGSIVAMSGVIAALVVNASGSAIAGVLVGIGAGLLVGIFNGVVVAGLGINALIATLATMQIVRGLAYIVSGGSSVGIANARFYQVGLSTFLGVPTPLWILLACIATFGFILKQTIFGRETLAIGGNVEAARLAGIKVRRTRLIIFAAQGAVAGLAGVVAAARFTSGQPKTAEGLELQVISACVLGGVSLTGGVGNMPGVVAGVLLLGSIKNAMDLENVPPFYQYVASGAILLAAVLLDRLQRRGRA